MIWDHLYTAQKRFADAPVLLEGTVVHGFKRGT
jgi:hypothetical protein